MGAVKTLRSGQNFLTNRLLEIWFFENFARFGNAAWLGPELFLKMYKSKSSQNTYLAARLNVQSDPSVAVV